MPIAFEVADTPVGWQYANKHLIDDVLWERMTRRIVKEEEVTLGLAERIIDSALGFLLLCAKDPEGKYGPSPLVDIGWHTFILYTVEYWEFCMRIAGKYIHHRPNDMPGMELVPRNGVEDSTSSSVTRTVQALKLHGIAVDKPLWECAANPRCAKCQNCECDRCSY